MYKNWARTKVAQQASTANNNWNNTIFLYSAKISRSLKIRNKIQENRKQKYSFLFKGKMEEKPANSAKEI